MTETLAPAQRRRGSCARRSRASTPSSSAAATTASTCAAYLAAAGLSVCVLERRGVVGGAAVTEEFHPGFRNSTASYTVSLLDPQGDRATCKLAAHGLAIVERPFANFLPLSARRRLPQGRRRPRRDAGGGRALLAARCARRCPRTTRCSSASPTCCASCCSPRRRTSAARHRARWLDAMEGRASAFARSTLAGPARRARPLHEERRRDARPLVRVGADQGGVRLRRGRRQLREPVHARLRVRAAASRVRRGERQARAVGTRASAAWARSRRRWRAECAARGVAIRTGAPVARVIVEGRSRDRCRARERRGRRGEARRRQRQSEAAVRAGSSTPSTCRPTSARASTAIAAGPARSG